MRYGHPSWAVGAVVLCAAMCAALGDGGPVLLPREAWDRPLDMPLLPLPLIDAPALDAPPLDAPALALAGLYDAWLHDRWSSGPAGWWMYPPWPASPWTSPGALYADWRVPAWARDWPGAPARLPVGSPLWAQWARPLLAAQALDAPLLPPSDSQRRYQALGDLWGGLIAGAVRHAGHDGMRLRPDPVTDLGRLRLDLYARLDAEGRDPAPDTVALWYHYHRLLGAALARRQRHREDPRP